MDLGKSLITSYLLAVMAAIAHLLAVSSILEVIARALRGERRVPEYAWATYVLILLVWWAVFFLLLEVVR